MSEAVTEVRRQILRNIEAGRPPYDGFIGSSAGGALRSMQRWTKWHRYITYDTDVSRLALTDLGKRELYEEQT